MFGRIWKVTKTSVSSFVEDDAMSLSAALAFYTALSMAPLLVLLLRVASWFGEGTQQKMTSQIQGMVGEQAGQGIKMMIDNAEQQPGWGSIAGIVSLIVLLFSATGVFAQLQYSLNRVWDVKPKPSQGIWGWLRKRLLTLGMVFALGFLLMVSLAASGLINVLVPGNSAIWRLVHLGVSLGVFALLFALIYKYLPDVEITWRNVWTGAIVTAVLFILGKFLIGLYLGHSSVGSSYGAAGSLMVLLLWVYYSSLLFFFGAEVTQAQARLSGAPIQPSANAEWEPDAPESHGMGGRGGVYPMPG